MSLKKKLEDIAVRAATEAVQVEKARCLWLMDCMLVAAKDGLNAKLLPDSMRHIAETKLQLINVIVGQVRRGIIAGTRPPTAFSVLRQPILDQGEMQTRISDLINLLGELGYGENTTIDDVRKQIAVWEKQEDRIEELENENEKRTT